MKRAALMCSLILACGTAMANPYFSGNPYSPIPPGCLTLPNMQSTLYGDNRVLFWEGRINSGRNWWPADTAPAPNEMVPVDVRLFRVACSEPNRSAIVAEMQYTGLGRWPYRFPLLSFSAEQPWRNGLGIAPDSLRIYRLETMPEPGMWRDTLGPGGSGQYMLGDYTGGWLPMQGFTWTYIIDAPGPGSRAFSADQLISAREYNESFNLYIHIPGSVGQTVWVPATRYILEQNQRLPLNGRLSGPWVTEGANDQGLVLSFSNRVPASGQATGFPERSALNLFLSWYTFDAAGQMLWLTGVAEFPQGSSQVDIPIELVTGGEFQGSRLATRSEAGQVTLTALGCNNLQLDYDLPGVNGLGSGSHRLQRLIALEVAGYNCRDYELRMGLVELYPRN